MFSDATVRVLQGGSRKYFAPDLLIGELCVSSFPTVAYNSASLASDSIYTEARAFFTDKVDLLPSCVMEFKDDKILGDMCVQYQSFVCLLACWQYQGRRYAAASDAAPGTLAMYRTTTLAPHGQGP